MRFLNCRLSANFVVNTMRERMRGSKGCFGIINANSFDDAQKLSYMDLASIST